MSQSPAPARRKPKRGLAALFKPAPARLAGDKIQRGVLVVAIALLVAMVAVAIVLALSTHDSGAGVTSFVLFAAASAIGAGLGFLFGMPRTRLGDGPPAASVSTFYLTNSNLIKVSDWLTTIVIGLGLVNLGKAVPAVRRLAHALHQPLGGAPYSGAVAISVMIVGLLAGFILNYLWTSIRVRELLEESERQLEQVPELRDRTIAEARAELAGTGLTLVVPPGTPEDNKVVEQTLPPGAAVPRGTAVAVTMVPPAPEGDTTQVLRPPGP